MNNSNTNNNFEHFLRHSIEDFKMIPSRKTWYSIYNNMHPDRKWPSMAICLLILSCILFLDVANNNKIYKNANLKLATIHAKNVSSSNNFIATELLNQNNKNTTSNDVTENLLLSSNKKSNIDYKPNSTIINKTANNNSQKTTVVTNTSTITDNYTNNAPENNTKNLNEKIGTSTAIIKDAIIISESSYNSETNSIENSISIADKSNKIVAVNLSKNTSSVIINNESNQNQKVDSKEKKNENIVPKITSTFINKSDNSDIAFKEDFAFRNKPLPNTFKQKASLSYYLTPSIGYRNLKQIRDNKNTNSASAISTTNPNNDAAFNDTKALNVELGAVLNYKISKAIDVKIGIQTNYTNYISKVLDLGHTTQTNIATNSFAAYSNRTSTIAAINGNDNLNKSTLQISLPMGADVKVIGNNTLSWHIGATLQPTYVISGSAFVLSDDTKNYVAEKSLLRRFNLNTAIESFVSIKTSSATYLHIGPQFRTQLFSTYKSAYNYSEKLYNLGIKIGVTTTF